MVSLDGGEAWYLAIASSQGGPCKPLKVARSPHWICAQGVAVEVAEAPCAYSTGSQSCFLRCTAGHCLWWAPLGLPLLLFTRCADWGHIYVGYGVGVPHGFRPQLWLVWVVASLSA